MLPALHLRSVAGAPLCEASGSAWHKDARRPADWCPPACGGDIHLAAPLLPAQLNFVRTRLIGQLPNLDAAVPDVGKLARELQVQDCACLVLQCLQAAVMGSVAQSAMPCLGGADE